MQAELARNGRVECHIIECDSVAYRDGVSYSVGDDQATDRVITSTGHSIRLGDCGLLWMRRIRANQLLAEQVTPAHRDIINSDCRGALSGLLATKFRGKWYSHPEASFRASDKVAQLQVAHDCGFRVPRTLVSQSQSDIAAFFDREGGRMIVKAVVGVAEPFLRTMLIEDLETFNSDAFAVSPAIYQEFVPGTRHLRILSYGGMSRAGIIDTPDVDWRPNLNVPIEAYVVDAALQRRIDGVLDALGLSMGVIDIKIDDAGDFVWLEVNPQGQFAFLEPLTGQSLLRDLASFFESEVLN